MTFQRGDVLVEQNVSWEKLEAIRVISDGAELKFFKFGDAGGFVAEPDRTEVFVVPRDRSSLQKVEQVVAKELDAASNGLALKTLKEAVMTRFPEATDDQAERYLKILVAMGDLTATRKGVRVSLKLTAGSRTRERRRNAIAAFAHDLVTQSDQIGRLIHHNLTAGSFREDMLRSLLKRHVPNRFHVATGFIDGYEPQIDILIYDSVEYAPLFRMDDLVVVPADAVRAVIEVKTNLTREELTDALQHLTDARPSDVSGPPVFTGVFAYEGATVDTLLSAISDFYDDTTEDMNFNSISGLEEVVTAVCVLRSSILFSTFLNANVGLAPWMVELVSRSEREFEAALFFDRLLRHLRTPFEGPRADRSAADALASDVAYGRKMQIGGTEYYPWGPWQIDHEAAINQFQRRWKAYGAWLAGESWDESE
jgi:hypothetical protein